MKRDTIFYEIFLNFPNIFFEIIGKPEIETNYYEFTSREIKQIAFRLDGLFFPTDNDNNKPFYLVEVQFQRDESLYYRIFAELFLLLKQYEPSYPWRIVVIYPNRSIETEHLHQFEEMLHLNRVQRIYLDEIEQNSLGIGIIKLAIVSKKQGVDLAKSLIRQAQEQLTNLKIQQDVIDLIETIIVYKLPNKTRKEIEAMLGLSEIKKTKVYQEALAEGKEIGEKIGEKRGEKRGEKIGELHAKLALIPELVKEGFNVQKIANLLKLPIDTVQEVIDSLDK